MSRFLLIFILLFSVLNMATTKASSHALQPNATLLVADDSTTIDQDFKFLKKYNSLVARAYFKLIVQAERADIRLGKEYINLYESSEQNLHNLGVQDKFMKVYHRFLTHRRMLSGLKSWRIFSDKRTGDLEYFKAEYRTAVYQMYKKRSSDDKMIVFLMYKLADLYHHPD